MRLMLTKPKKKSPLLKDETPARVASDLAIAKDLLKKLLSDAKRRDVIGCQMSTLLYKLGGTSAIPDATRSMCADLSRQWDEIVEP